MMEWHNLCAHYRTLLVCVCPKKFLETPLCKTLGLVRSNQRKLLLLPCISNTMSGLTVCVTRWWAGRDNAILPEPTSSHANCLKTRRLPPVGCTLCWVAVILETYQLQLNTTDSSSRQVNITQLRLSQRGQAESFIQRFSEIYSYTIFPLYLLLPNLP